MRPCQVSGDGWPTYVCAPERCLEGDPEQSPRAHPFPLPSRDALPPRADHHPHSGWPSVAVGIPPLALPAAPASRVRQSPWYGSVDALDRRDTGRRAVLAGSPEAVPGESPMRWSTTNPGAEDPLPTPPPPCTPSVEAAADDDRRKGKQHDADRRAEEEWESDGGAMGPSPEAAHEPTG
jgi:hypothetical protein